MFECACGAAYRSRAPALRCCSSSAFMNQPAIGATKTERQRHHDVAPACPSCESNLFVGRTEGKTADWKCWRCGGWWHDDDADELAGRLVADGGTVTVENPELFDTTVRKLKGIADDLERLDDLNLTASTIHDCARDLEAATRREVSDE